MREIRIPMRLVAALLVAWACLAPRAATAALTLCTSDCLSRVNRCKATCTSAACRTNCDNLCGFSDCADTNLNFTGITPIVTRRDAHHAVVTGHVQCPVGGAFGVRVTLSQRFGAVAFGSTRGACTGDQAPFAIKVHTQLGTALIDAPVDVCALGVLVGKHGILDTKQWCQDGALVDGAGGR